MSKGFGKPNRFSKIPRNFHFLNPLRNLKVPCLAGESSCARGEGSDDHARLKCALTLHPGFCVREVTLREGAQVELTVADFVGFQKT